MECWEELDEYEIINYGKIRRIEMGDYAIVEKMLDEKNKKIKELQFALLDVLSGRHRSFDIQYDTGLDLGRCKELENLYNKIYKEVGEEWKIN
jgi:hypothetical protein